MAPSWELSVSLCYWKIRYSTVAVTWVRLWCCNHPLLGNVSMLHRPSSKPGLSILYQSIPCMELPWDRDEAMQKEPVLKETKTFAYTTHLHVLALPKPIVFFMLFLLDDWLLLHIFTFTNRWIRHGKSGCVVMWCHLLFVLFQRLLAS